MNPNWRKEKSLKIFRKNLNAKEAQKNAALEKRMENPLDILRRREEKAKKQIVHDDEGVADLSEEDEIADMLDPADGSLVATESNLVSTKPRAADTTRESTEEYVNAAEVHAHMVLLFENETEILRLLYNPYSRSKSSAPSADMFFFHNIVVPPNRYRMEDKAGDSISENPKNSLLKAVLNACETMRQITREMRGAEPSLRRRREFTDLQNAWVNLQSNVNAIVDKDSNPAGRNNANIADGVKQRLEKKEGLFRKNTQGKRVNFAARSVISPYVLAHPAHFQC